MNRAKDKTIILQDEKATLKFGAKVSKQLPERIIICLHGELGAGKTTFVRGLLQALGHKGVVKSPTYTLVEPYCINKKNIYHFDLYRLLDPEELELIGVRDYFEHSICLIEWPEKGKGYLPVADLHLDFSIQPVGRSVKLIAETEAGQKILKKL